MDLLQVFNIPAVIIVLSSLITFELILILSNFSPKTNSNQSPPLTKLMFWGDSFEKYIRNLIYTLTIIFTLCLSFLAFTSGDFITNMVRWFGLSAMIMLFIVLVPGLIRIYFPQFIFNELLITSRRALGLSCFLFALIHGTLALIFYYHLSWTVFLNLNPNYKLAVVLGMMALVILSLLAITSNDKIISLLTFRKWKRLHRLIYFASVMILLHAFLRGSDFRKYSETLPFFTAYFAQTFILLEVGATAVQLLSNHSKRPLWRSLIYYVLLIILVAYSFFLVITNFK